MAVWKAAGACAGLTDLFFSPEDDGRTEAGRSEREDEAKDVCRTCPVRYDCLEHALVWHEDMGVWGAMGEGERRRFVQHLKDEGYENQIPTGVELLASLNQFYIKEGDLVQAQAIWRFRRGRGSRSA